MSREVNPKAILLARLEESDLGSLANFNCVDDNDSSEIAMMSEDMNAFLRTEAYDQQQLHMNSTVLLYYAGELAGYVSTCTDAIRLEESEIETETCAYPVVPAIKIARLAVDRRFRGFGFGELLIEYVRDLCSTLSANVGIRFITLDAYPHRVEYYRRLGFKENLLYARDKRKTMISMRSDYYVTSAEIASVTDEESVS